jgi:hypothetical protein
MVSLCITNHPLNSLLTPLIAAIAVYIAIQQFRLARRKLKLDLYEKRFKIYNEIRDFMSRILKKDHTVNYDEFNSMMFNVLEMEFLFKKDLCDYVYSLLDMMSQIMGILNNLDNPNVSKEDKITYRNDYQKLIDNLFNEYRSIEKHFKKYLDFRNL